MRRRLSPDERDLWRRTVRDVTPLKRLETVEQRPVCATKPLPPEDKVKWSARPRTNSTARTVPPDPFSAGDPNIDRLAKRGRLPIDATFDLHGHSQASARAAIYGFILEARARGHGCVLVITGKGTPSAGGATFSAGRGVLRARFKEWLREDAFRQHIVRASAAHPRHGGAGAFYVFLKKRRAD